jgi:diguanylate cyclase (GGDEF)-like protein/PAS domain S-box-containing protein
MEERLEAAQRALFESETKYTTLVEQLPCAIYIDEPDPNGSTLFVSPQIEELLGITPQQYMDAATSWDELVHPDDRDRMYEEYDAFIRTGQPESGDYRFLRPDGTVVWVHDRSKLISDADGTPMYVQGAMFDITAQKEAEQRIAHLAYHDALTDLPNRAMFEESIELALARAKRNAESVAVLFLDLDDFKSVNDAYGHSVGDQVLQVVASRLQRATRATDLVVRQSGDEFLVLMADLTRGPGGSTAREAVRTVEERIMAELDEPLVLGGYELSTSASLGVGVFPDDGEDERELLHHADTQMYERKRERAERLAG